MIETPSSAGIAPEHCESMLDVRSGVDAVDRELVTLLARRFAYMRAAARIKPTHGAVRDEARKAAVIGNAVAAAGHLGAPEGAVARLWEHLVEESIAYEAEEWSRLHAAD